MNHRLSTLACATLLALASFSTHAAYSDQPLPFVKQTASWGKTLTTDPATPSQRPNSATQHADERFLDHRTYVPSPSVTVSSTTLSSSLDQPSHRIMRSEPSPSSLASASTRSSDQKRTQPSPARNKLQTQRQHIVLKSAAPVAPLSTIRQHPQPTNITLDPQSHQALCSAVDRIWSQTSALTQSGAPNADAIALKTYLKIIKTCSIDEAKGSAFQMTRTLPLTLIESTLQSERLSDSPAQLAARYFLQTYLLYHYHGSPDTSATPSATNPFAALRLTPSDAQNIAQAASSFKDPTPLSVLAWTAQNAKAFSAAETLFRQALRITPDDSKIREGLVYSLLAQGKTLATEPELSRLDGDSLLYARSATLQKQAAAAFSSKKYADAVALFQQAQQFSAITDTGTQTLFAWALLKSNDSAAALQLFSELYAANPSSNDIASGYVEALIASKDYTTLQTLVASPPPGTTTRVNNALADYFDAQGDAKLAHQFSPLAYPASNAPTAAAPLLSSLHKTGVAGENELSLNAITLTATAPNPLSSNSANSLDVALSKISLDDGASHATTHELRIGGTQTLSAAPNPLVLSTTLGISRIPDALSNSTINRATANLALRQYTTDGFLEATIAHEPDTSSLRSYIGNSTTTVTTTPSSPTPTIGSLFQGQAMKSSLGFNGASALSLPLGDSAYTLTWQSSIGSLSGKNFQSTTLFNGQAQLLKQLPSSPTVKWLAIGPEVRLATSSADQNRFTAGYAGAYAPLSESSLGARAYYTLQPSPNLLLKGTSWVGLAKKEFATSSSSNFALETELASAYKLNNHLSLLGSFAWKNTAGFNSSVFFLGLNVTLDPQPKLTEKHLAPFKALNHLR